MTRSPSPQELRAPAAARPTQPLRESLPQRPYPDASAPRTSPDSRSSDALAKRAASDALIQSDTQRLQAEVLALRREVAGLRSLRQRDQATSRGLGASLQQLRRGALALRAENEELRRALHAARATRRR